MKLPHHQTVEYPGFFLFLALFLTVTSLCSFAAAPVFAQLPSSDVGTYSVRLLTEDHSCAFVLSLPTAGLVSIYADLTAKTRRERLWGPQFMSSGSYRINLAKDRLSGRTGVVRFFDISMQFRGLIGRMGSGVCQFVRPLGLGFDTTRHELYVADTGNDRIIRLTPDGQFLGQYGGFGVAFGERSEEREDSLDEPFDVAPGGFSNFYVADQNNDRICEFDAYKNFKGRLFPRSDDRRHRLNRPRGIRVDGERNLWVVDGRADRVLKVAPNGDQLLEIGGFGVSRQRLKDPTQLDIDSGGRVFVVDRGNRRIAVFDRLGGFLSELRQGFRHPEGIAIDEEGLLLVCDSGTEELLLLTPQGIELERLARPTAGERWRQPLDIDVFRSLVFVLDSGNHRVVVLERIVHACEIPWQVPASVVE